jgi:large subunit ribosomal protein L21
MYAIIENAGRQYKVAEGDVLDIDLRKADAGEALTFDMVKLLERDGEVKVGTPNVDGASVTAEVMGIVKAPKVRGISFRRRKGSRVKYGHRQQYTRLRITGINA